MADNLSILLTCAAIMIVGWRAIKLDRLLPWFAVFTDPAAAAALLARRSRHAMGPKGEAKAGGAKAGLTKAGLTKVAGEAPPRAGSGQKQAARPRNRR